MSLCFFEQKKLGTKYVFLVLLVFENRKQFSKTVIKQALNVCYVFKMQKRAEMVVLFGKLQEVEG